MTHFVRALLAMLIGLLLGLATSFTAVAAPALPGLSCTHDLGAYDAGPTSTTIDPGPPATHDPAINRYSVDWQAGVSARLEVVATHAHNAQDMLARSARVAGEGIATRGPQTTSGALVLLRRDVVAAKAVPSEGIYVVRNGAGDVYVGQSGSITSRLGQHVSTGKFTQAEVDAAERFEVLGGKDGPGDCGAVETGQLRWQEGAERAE